MFVLILLLVATFLLWEIFRFYRRAASLPPGPFAVPLLGNYVNVITPPFEFRGMRRMNEKFGPVTTVHAPFPVVNIADFETMRDAFRSNDMSGRMHNIFFETTRMVENGGIINSDGEEWKEQRRFAIATLRDFGMGKNLMEEKVRLSARNMVDFISKKGLNNGDLRWPIQVFVSNIVNEFLFGFQFPFDDCSELMDFVHGFNDAIEKIANSKIVMITVMMPWLRHVPFIRSSFLKVQSSLLENTAYISKQAKAVKYDPNEEPTCFVQAFHKKGKDQRFEQLLACCLDIFTAGQETTTSTLRWAMLFLAAHPEAQEKLRTEIHEKIGKDRIAAMSDKANMPYTSATINEIQRCGNIVAVNPVLYHRTTVETRIGGFIVPANTMVNGDLHQMMQTDPLFEQPERFWPERYLAEDGVTLRKELVERTIPFGIGKRQCAGEGLARAELFIGLVSLVQHFRISPLPGAKIDLEPIYTSFHFPKPQNFRLERV
ncbi:hypothetical protein PFISCL1PPCAC_13688 [Pristionchus fissidentatus]|uniref:Cytochrome P450 n=1 Tax=Pristionchus fissidentatus TaxID=1538716 RepID=A0AAV5VSH1_9BILA|nr:hypothetical protein PFISCL1PPCAC_13688 [Pristionchus fissidentatus]